MLLLLGRREEDRGVHQQGRRGGLGDAGPGGAGGHGAAGRLRLRRG